MERWQLSQKELAKYGIIENTIEGYLKVDLAAEEPCLSICNDIINCVYLDL